MSPCRLHSQYTATADFESALKVNSLIIKPSVPLTMDFKIKWEGLVVLIRPELHQAHTSVKCFLICSGPRLAGILRLAHAKALSDKPETSKRGDYIRRQWVSV